MSKLTEETLKESSLEDLKLYYGKMLDKYRDVVDTRDFPNDPPEDIIALREVSTNLLNTIKRRIQEKAAIPDRNEDAPVNQYALSTNIQQIILHHDIIDRESVVVAKNDILRKCDNSPTNILQLITQYEKRTFAVEVVIACVISEMHANFQAYGFERKQEFMTRFVEITGLSQSTVYNRIHIGSLIEENPTVGVMLDNGKVEQIDTMSFILELKAHTATQFSLGFRLIEDPVERARFARDCRVMTTKEIGHFIKSLQGKDNTFATIKYESDESRAMVENVATAMGGSVSEGVTKMAEAIASGALVSADADKEESPYLTQEEIAVVSRVDLSANAASDFINMKNNVRALMHANSTDEFTIDQVLDQLDQFFVKHMPSD